MLPMLAAMRRLPPEVCALTVFWTIYALGAVWVFYKETTTTTRDLVLIIAGYCAVIAVVTGAMMLRAKLRRLRHKPETQTSG